MQWCCHPYSLLFFPKTLFLSPMEFQTTFECGTYNIEIVYNDESQCVVPPPWETSNGARSSSPVAGPTVSAWRHQRPCTAPAISSHYLKIFFFLVWHLVNIRQTFTVTLTWGVLSTPVCNGSNAILKQNLSFIGAFEDFLFGTILKCQYSEFNTCDVTFTLFFICNSFFQNQNMW